MESLIIFSDFFRTFLNVYENRKKVLLEQYGTLIMERYNLNKPNRKSFGFEWGLLKRNETKVWHNDVPEFEKELFIELDEPKDLKGLLAMI